MTDNVDNGHTAVDESAAAGSNNVRGGRASAAVVIDDESTQTEREKVRRLKPFNFNDHGEGKE